MTEKQRAELFAIRKALDGFVIKIADNPAEINENTSAIRAWTPGSYAIGDVRVYEGIPYKCVQAHDSGANTAWTPDKEAALWMQYHGTTVESARPWVKPQGAHDIYKTGEFMVWTDGLVYECISNTNFSPDEYAQAWSLINT